MSDGKPGILIVDNDPTVLEFLASALRTNGFKTWQATSAPVAYQLLQNHHSEIDLVLSDVEMPEKTGPDLIRELKLLRPELRCVLITAGDAARYSVEELLQCGVERLLLKPFPIVTLLDAITPRT